MLGYGCSSTEEPLDMYGPPVEYGTPHADFIIKGRVMDESGTPVQGIKTSLKKVFENNNKHYALGVDSVQSDVSGNYQLKSTDRQNQYDKVIVEDIDGEANGGEFLSDTLDVDYNKAVKTKDGDGKWYLGIYEITQDVKLKKKP
jgi:putative lipoprotein (rSAM/lipoprotein system)